jgi:hypothetical protein
MNTDTKVLKKAVSNKIQNHLKRSYTMIKLLHSRDARTASIDEEKSFLKIRHLFMIKELKKLGV